MNKSRLPKRSQLYEKLANLYHSVRGSPRALAWWISGFPCGVRHDSSAAGIGRHFVAVSLFARKDYNLKNSSRS
jgi:hypothetical protein